MFHLPHAILHKVILYYPRILLAHCNHCDAEERVFFYKLHKLCVSLEVSLFAGLIGEICAFVLFKRNEVENASLLATYSLVQFYEAFSYHIDETPKFPIQTLLALQGVAYFVPVCMNDRQPLSISCLTISICILLATIVIKEPYTTNCMFGCRWELGNMSKALMFLMYIVILGYGLVNENLKTFSMFAIASLIVALMPVLMKRNLS